MNISLSFTKLRFSESRHQISWAFLGTPSMRGLKGTIVTKGLIVNKEKVKQGCRYACIRTFLLCLCSLAAFWHSLPVERIPQRCAAMQAPNSAWAVGTVCEPAFTQPCIGKRSFIKTIGPCIVLLPLTLHALAVLLLCIYMIMGR